MKAEPSGRTSLLRVVIDTNVWISATLSQAGTPTRLVRQALKRGLPVFSEDTFAEFETRLWRPKFDRYLSMELRKRVLHDLNAAAMWVEVSSSAAIQKFCRDADDDKFIHTALSAETPWLVTGDQDLLEVPPMPRLRILSPADALQLPEFSA